MLLQVSMRLVNKTDVRQLGLKLQVDEFTIAAKLKDESEITNAAHEVLKVWFYKKQDRQVAYQVLGQALVDVQLNFIAREVLNY